MSIIHMHVPLLSAIAGASCGYLLRKASDERRYALFAFSASLTYVLGVAVGMYFYSVSFT